MQITGISGKVKLNNGVEMPYFGLGVFQVEDGSQVINAINYALEAGYRHIDTASFYGNEKGVGEAVRNSSIPREEIFVTSKVWNSDQGYDSTLKAFDITMKKFGFDYLDLYLIHWPVKSKYKDTWKAFESIYKEGRVKAIGISNFLEHQIEDLLQAAEIVPMVNQMEFHPYLVQQDLIDYCYSKNIRYEAWSPLMQGMILSDEVLTQLAEKYNKTTAQIVLRWNLQKGVVTIPKSVKKERIFSNSRIFDFELTQEDVRIIDALDKNKRIGPDPGNFDF
ncbi:MAG: aldo/keto reductase [Ignavibacteria bacterium]|jgi:diketogulonate reductase-like aldo/keto reductase